MAAGSRALPNRQALAQEQNDDQEEKHQGGLCGRVAMVLVHLQAHVYVSLIYECTSSHISPTQKRESISHLLKATF